MVPAVIRVPGRTESRRLEGKIDSGADICAVPDDIIAALDLPPVRVVRAAGLGGLLQEAMLYHCAMEVAGYWFEHIEALGTRRRYAIIGRNVLRDLVVRLDGPKSMLSFASTSTRKRTKSG